MTESVTEPVPPRRSRRLVVALLFLVFAAGAGVGVAATQILRSCRLAGPPRPGEIVSAIARDLDLDAATERRVREILDARRPQMDALFARVHPEMERLRAEVNAEIRAALPPERREAFDELVSKMPPPPGSPAGPPPGPPR